MWCWYNQITLGEDGRHNLMIDVIMIGRERLIESRGALNLHHWFDRPSSFVCMLTLL